MSKILSVFFIAFFLLPFGVQAQSIESENAGENWANQLAAANLKASADAPISAQNMSTQAAAAAFARVLQTGADNYANISAIREAAVTVAIKAMLTMDPKEAMAVTKTMQSDQAQQIMSLMSALGGGQQAAKVAQTTPPALQ